MAAEGAAVADHDEFFAGAGHGYINAPVVAQESDLAFVIAADKGDINDVALLSLERVDSVYIYLQMRKFVSGIFKLFFHINHLFAVRGNDADREIGFFVMRQVFKVFVEDLEFGRIENTP